MPFLTSKGVCMNLFVDSGAPTLYNRFFRNNTKSGAMGASISDRKHDDFSFVDSDQYIAFRESYVNFLLEHKGSVDAYANLDVINNAELTWKNQKYMESKGLNPIPVFHFGNDLKNLVRYLKEGYEYIAIGGLIPNSYEVLKSPLDYIWDKYLTDEKGYPLVKVHGFAVTSPRLMHRYPWYSVDSTTWLRVSRMGMIMFPKIKSGIKRFDLSPIRVQVSDLGPQEQQQDSHVDHMSKIQRMTIIKEIENKGFKLGKSEFVNGKRVVIEDGLCNNYVSRDIFNMLYMIDLQEHTPKWPWPFKVGTRGFI